VGSAGGLRSCLVTLHSLTPAAAPSAGWSAPRRHCSTPCDSTQPRSSAASPSPSASPRCTERRTTNDVDTVSEGEGPRDLALQYLGDRDAARANRIEIDGVKVDVMETWPLPANEGDLPDDDLDRLFVVGHRRALDSATPVQINAVSPECAVPESGTLTVATVSALVACKLHAIADRKGPSLSKRESDALDLVRLVGDLVRSDESVEALRSAPFDLAALVAAELKRWFVTDALRTARLANAAGAVDGQLEAADVSTVGGLLLDQLRL